MFNLNFFLQKKIIDNPKITGFSLKFIAGRECSFKIILLLQNYFIDRFDLIRTAKVRLNAVLDIGIITKIGIKTKLLILQRAILTSLNPFYSMKPHLTSFNKIWRMLAYLTTANQKVACTGLFLYLWFSDVFRGKERDQGFLKILLMRQSWGSSGATN